MCLCASMCFVSLCVEFACWWACKHAHAFSWMVFFFYVQKFVCVLCIRYRGFPTRMVYLKHDILQRYTILVGNPRYCVCWCACKHVRAFSWMDFFCVQLSSHGGPGRLSMTRSSISLGPLGTRTSKMCNASIVCVSVSVSLCLSLVHLFHLLSPLPHIHSPSKCWPSFFPPPHPPPSLPPLPLPLFLGDGGFCFVLRFEVWCYLRMKIVQCIPDVFALVFFFF